MTWDKEAIHDEQIAPLMTQIIAICKEHNIPMVAQFQYQDTEESGPGYVTTTLPIGEASDHIHEMASRMRPSDPVAFAETVVTKPDGSRHVTIRRIS